MEPVDPDPGGSKTCGSGGSGSATLVLRIRKYFFWFQTPGYVILNYRYGRPINYGFGRILHGHFVVTEKKSLTCADQKVNRCK
jgi:hypothetical protein